MSTCASASLLSLLPKASLVSSTRPEDKGKAASGPTFTHLFIDESSQAQLPEVLVPIALTSPHTQLVSATTSLSYPPLEHASFARALVMASPL